MDQAGGHMDPVNYLRTQASALPHPRPHLFSPICQETQVPVPGSSASNGGLSEVVKVRSFDSAIQSLVKTSLDIMSQNDFY